MGTTYTAIALAFVPIFVRISEVGPIATAFYRFFLSFPFLMAWMIIDQVHAPTPRMPTTPKDYMLILGAGTFLALDITLWHWSIMYTTIINATLLNNLTTVFVALGAWVFLKQSVALETKKGIALAFLGSFILVGYNAKLDMGHVWGDMLALISALFFTAFILMVKELRRHFRSPTILAWGALPTLYILGAISYMTGERFFPVTKSGWWPLLGMAFLVHILGQGLMTYSMGMISATLSSLILGLSPLFAALLAWVIFDESLTWLQVFGAVIVLWGIYIAKRSDRQ
jgi:drug/metabolite transporter (DMT)-like permease